MDYYNTDIFSRMIASTALKNKNKKGEKKKTTCIQAIVLNFYGNFSILQQL